MGGWGCILLLSLNDTAPGDTLPAGWSWANTRVPQAHQPAFLVNEEECTLCGGIANSRDGGNDAQARPCH